MREKVRLRLRVFVTHPRVKGKAYDLLVVHIPVKYRRFISKDGFIDIILLGQEAP